MRKFWTKSETEWLIENAPRLNNVQHITQEHNKIFEPRTYSAVKGQIKKLKIPVRKYTEQEQKWITDNYKNYPKIEELTADYNRVFGRNKSKQCMTKWLSDNNCLSEEQELPVGTIVKAGRTTYIKVKLTKGLGGQKGLTLPYWENYAKYMYQQYYGELPKGYRIARLNMNCDDFSKENLYACSPYVMAQMMANQWWSTDKNMTLAAIKWCELSCAIKNIKINLQEKEVQL